MDIFYFVYADPQGNLENLSRERKEHHDLLIPRFLDAKLNFQQNSDFSIETLYDALQGYFDKITIFHFSGHAGQRNLALQDGNAFAEGMSRQLATLLAANPTPKLTLVFLNGCSTAGMVRDLLDAGVPIVIATSAAVNDSTAANFSIDFYSALVKGKTIREAFSHAEDKLLMIQKQLRVYKQTGPPIETNDESVWGIFTQRGMTGSLNWKIQTLPAQAGAKHQYDLNAILKGSIFNILLNAGLPDIENLQNQRDQGRDIREKVEVNLLLGYPGQVSYAIANLFKAAKNEDDEERITVVRNQFANLYQVFQSLSETVFLISLSQLWEICLACGPEPLLPVPNFLVRTELEIIRKFFIQERKIRKQSFDYVKAFRSVGDIFAKAEKPFYTKELQELKNALSDDPELIECYRSFLENQQYLITRSYLQWTVDELERKCQESEKLLSVFFEKLSFLAAYDFGVLKKVEFQVPRYNNQHFYRYELAKLPKHGSLAYLSANPKMNGFTSTSSVLMLKSDCFITGENILMNEGQINFYPFLLDRLVDDPSAEKGDLIIYSHYDKHSQCLFYEGAYKARSDRSIPVDQLENFHLRMTFNAFISVLFEQDLETLY